MHRDLVVLGGSAGGVEAILGLLRALPSDFAAALCIVLHIPAEAPSRLPLIFGRACALPVVQAEDEQPIEPGKVYVSYKRPWRQEGSAASRASLKEVEALLDSIAREALGLR